MGEGGSGGSGISFLWRTCGRRNGPNNGATQVCYCAVIRPLCCQLRLMFGVKYFCRSTSTILAGSDGCSFDDAPFRVGVAAGSEDAEDQTA